MTCEKECRISRSAGSCSSLPCRSSKRQSPSRRFVLSLDAAHPPRFQGRKADGAFRGSTLIRAPPFRAVRSRARSRLLSHGEHPAAPYSTGAAAPPSFRPRLGSGFQRFTAYGRLSLTASRDVSGKRPLLSGAGAHRLLVSVAALSESIETHCRPTVKLHCSLWTARADAAVRATEPPATLTSLRHGGLHLSDTMKRIDIYTIDIGGGHIAPAQALKEQFDILGLQGPRRPRREPRHRAGRDASCATCTSSTGTRRCATRRSSTPSTAARTTPS